MRRSCPGWEAAQIPNSACVRSIISKHSMRGQPCPPPFRGSTCFRLSKPCWCKSGGGFKFDRQRETVPGEAIYAPDEALRVETRGEDLMAVCFSAMASPCEVLLPAAAGADALEIGTLVAQEAWRVEKKFSRYRSDSVTAWIHANRGTNIEVDEETASLIDFAAQCFALSGGLFDVTSGV